MASSNKSLSGPQLLLISLALAGTAVLFNLLYIAKIQQQAAASTIEAYTLERTMMPGESLRAADIKTVQVPKILEPGLIEMGYLDKIQRETKIGEKITTVARRGELLTNRMFTTNDEAKLDEISVGKRLISLAINARTAPAMLRAGVYVDLEGAFVTGGAIPEIIPIMERVEIKAVGSRTINDEAAIAAGDKPRTSTNNYNTITIEVTPNDASVLAALQRLVVGSFELQIRSPNDREAAKLAGVATINPRLVEMVRTRQTEPGAVKTPVTR